MMKKLCVLILFLLIFSSFPSWGGEKSASELVEEAVNYYRGKASVASVTMIIHRPAWERSMTIKAWTKGTSMSIFTIVAPPKDHGNGTLKKGREMWTFNPKVNRVIKLPPSMMSQSWMGSDFSNNDLAKSDSILTEYDHTLESVKQVDGRKIYVIQSLPKPDAPVVWGMQRLEVRDDYILLLQEFYDEELKLVKAMKGYDIEMLGGRLFPLHWKMEKADSPGEYTLLEYSELQFLDDLPGRIFTLSHLRKPKR